MVKGDHNTTMHMVVYSELPVIRTPEMRPPFLLGHFCWLKGGRIRGIQLYHIQELYWLSGNSFTAMTCWCFLVILLI